MRVFFKEGSTVLEVTKEINSYKSDTYLLSFGTGDGLYIASDFPLNHFYIKMGSVLNSNPSTILIDYWTGNGWTPVVNQNDYTDALGGSGFIEFTPDRDVSWVMENTSSNGQTVTDLETITVYDKYWVRLKVSADLTDAIELKWIGNLFSEDDDLFSEFPLFNDTEFLSAFETGKTSWEEQHAKAAEIIIQDLKRKNIILGKEQILERDVLLPASVCKVAQIIFNAFGKDYSDQLLRARDEYDKRMDLRNFVTDLNNNAIPDPIDRSMSQGWLSR